MSEALKREDLYALVWSEPMVKVAMRFGVSSSYLARVCSLLNVPRPERGYWAKLAFGKAPPKPSLPDARPGDELAWMRDSMQFKTVRQLPKPPEHLRRRPKRVEPSSGEHPLVKGAQQLFEAGRLAYRTGYLKPAKYLLVDLAVSKSGLARALSFANRLFLKLEAYGHRVVVAPSGERFYRAAVSPYEGKRRDQDNLWSPGRCTVVYIGTVAIGMTIIEISETAEARYVDGAFVRERDYVAPKRHRYNQDYSWTTQHDFPTGRLCLQAFSPYPGTEWVQQWREAKDRDLANRIPDIVKELQTAAGEVARLAEEAARQAEVDRQRREVEHARWQREREIQRVAEARKQSRAQLTAIIDRWAEAQNVAQFFKDVEETIRELNPPDGQELLDRLERARSLIGSIDAFDHFRGWKSPDEL